MVAHRHWLGGIDQGQREAVQRSLNTGNAGTVLLQTTISRVVQMLTNRSQGIQSTLPRRPGTGDGFYSNRRSAANTGGAWVGDTDEPVNAEGSYSQVKYAYKTLLGRVKVTRKLIDQGRSYGDVLATELIGKTEDLTEDLESASVIGDTASNSLSIDGLLTLVGGVSGQTVGNTTANAGDSLYISKFDETIQKVKGNANKSALRIYGSYKGSRLLNAALQAQQRFLADGFEIEGGFVVTSYQGIPVIETTGMPDDLAYDGTSGAITAFSGGDTTALVVVNTTYVFYSELNPLTVVPLAKKSSQYDEVDIYADLALVLDNDRGAAVLAGLA